MVLQQPLNGLVTTVSIKKTNARVLEAHYAQKSVNQMHFKLAVSEGRRADLADIGELVQDLLAALDGVTDWQVGFCAINQAAQGGALRIALSIDLTDFDEKLFVARERRFRQDKFMDATLVEFVNTFWG